MRKNNAFTLTETLIMVAVIGVIAVISAVSFRNIQPDKDTVMLRKAYSDISKAVATLINDQELYPLSMASADYTFQLQYLLQKSAARIEHEQTQFEDSLLNGSSCYSVPSSSGGSSSSSSGTTFKPTVNACPALAITNPNDPVRCQPGTYGAYVCDASCNYTCAPGYTAEIDKWGNKLCTKPETPTTSGGTSSTNLGDITPIEDFNYGDLKGEDITKGSENKGSTNLSEGNYNDVQTTSSSNGTTSVSLRPHGTVFLNTTVKPGVTAYTSNNKFAYNFGTLFKSKDLSCNDRVCTFTTDDGMSWTITDNFNTANQNATISVDVNGSGVGSNVSTGAKPDVFNFRIDASGSVTIHSTGTNDTAHTKALNTLKNRS